MESTALASPGEVLTALTPSRLHWKQLVSRFGELDQLVQAIATTPLFQHSYFALYGRHVEEMLQDIRSATSLLLCNMFTQAELDAFKERDVLHYVNQGLALAVPHLRKRLVTVDQSRCVEVCRMACFGFIFKQIAEDLADPRPLLTELVEQLEIEPSQRMSLIASVVTLFCPQSRSFTLH